MTSPAISVIVPVFNPGAYLGPLIDSLLAQTESSLEIVAVDDGSTDGSADLLRDVASRDARLVVVTRSNGGYAAARNSGIDVARGRWIGFADSDDWLDPLALQSWREHGEREGLEVVFGNGFRFRGDASGSVVVTTERVSAGRPPRGVFSGAEWIRHAVSNKSWLHFVWLQLIRRDVLTRCALRFDERIVHEDVLWSLHLGLRVQRIGYVDDLLYGYRIHPTSFTHDRTVELLRWRAASYVAIIERFVDAARARPDDAPLRQALLRHAQREGRNFFALMREGTLPPEVRRDLARDALRHGLVRAMFAGSESFSTRWRAVRCWARMRRCLM